MIVVSKKTLEKLRDKHRVALRDIEQCFDNRAGGFEKDNREQHRSNPPTQWFISATNQNRLLKICFIRRGSAIHIRTAYEPNEEEVFLYESKGNSMNF